MIITFKEVPWEDGKILRNVNTFVHNISYFYPALSIEDKIFCGELAKSLVYLHHEKLPLRVAETCEDIELLIREASNET